MLVLGTRSVEDDSPTGSQWIDSSSDGINLTPPVINLIPPTPSDIIDDDQFFDTNSEEENVEQMSGSEGVDSMDSFTPADQCSEEDKEEDNAKTICNGSDGQMDNGGIDLQIYSAEGADAGLVTVSTEEQSKPSFSRGSYRVAPLPEYPRKRSFNSGINLLQFTEHNLDDLSSKDAMSHELLKAELQLLPVSSKMSGSLHHRKPAVRSYSLEETLSRSHTFHTMGQFTINVRQENHVTTASHIPQAKDQNGNFAAKETSRQKSKPLAELNTEEVCLWFSSIGLQKCQPLIRDADLCGSHFTSINLNTLDLLQLSSVEERERLLSAIYQELHPPDSLSQRVDCLLEAFGTHNVEKFAAALVTMSKSQSSPLISCANQNRASVKFRPSILVAQRNSQLIEITINAMEQIVHLRTPRDTTVGKVKESCFKMLGVKIDKDAHILKCREDELSPEKHIGDLPGSENRLVELHLCKKEKHKEAELANSKDSQENGTEPRNLKHNSEKIRELHKQVDSLQNAILQVQELHQGLVAFCNELRGMETETETEGLNTVELERRVAEARGHLTEKRQSLQGLREKLSSMSSPKNRQAEGHLTDKMRLNCLVFKEEITLVHLNRQVNHLQSALEEQQAKEKTERKCCSTLGQLLSFQSPAMLLATQETRASDGYGFAAQHVPGQGLVVVRVQDSQICVGDRLVEVNGVSVVGSSEEELTVLLQQPTAHIVVLRSPAPETPAVGSTATPELLLNTVPWSQEVSTATSRCPLPV
ncbi:uncharacterized protein LOC114796001 [Denticeps clupeoides]|uniref:uncharacterized protein LOC114796001 n=1 Tax=Denticeps clupeoides TaxID=299321 RepID=UPI0010A53245|nr:uncharacterized protein LOC114796001 [Denticeps clupeoides]